MIDAAQHAPKSNAAALADFAVPSPGLAFMFRVKAEVEAPLEIGNTPRGMRRMIPILGGTAEGPRFSGQVIPGGIDYQLIVDPGMAEIHARYALEDAHGARIYVENTGLRRGPPDLIDKLRRGESVDPQQIYFRTAPRIETAAEAYLWMTRSLFVCSGARFPNHVLIDFYELT